MTTSAVDRQQAPAPPRRGPWWAQLLRLVGWLLIAAGVLVGLFIVYLLYWTGRDTAAAQQDLLAQWEATLEGHGASGDPEAAGGSDVLEDWQVDVAPGTALEDLPIVDEAVGADDPVATRPVDAGGAYAVLWFERDGRRIVNDSALAVVEGVTLDHLAGGPGHYPHTEAPGQVGNFAVAAHRTTNGAPFYRLDALQPGDEIHVIDRSGRHFVYDFVDHRVVAPHDVWVLGDDAPGPDGGAWMTMTTCHPRFSAAQRLVAFAQLRASS